MYKKLQINNFRLFHDQTIFFGKRLTVLGGRNSTGKSTILGMIANSGEIKKKDGITYSLRPFRAEFSELFKGSKQFDEIGPNRFNITISDNSGKETDYRSFRTAWQTLDKDRRKVNLQGNSPVETPLSKSPKELLLGRERFRVIPYKKLKTGGKTEAKFNYPVLYLGLSRLFPIGESRSDLISHKNITFKSEEHKDWFIKNYTNILSMQSEIKDITNYSLVETDKKSGIGINTHEYDYLTNSSGQDNLGQILMAVLSFKKLKEQQGDKWIGGILLIDELDATLHPAAQNKLIKLLIKEAHEIGIQIVLTTHSLNLLQYICTEIEYNNTEDDFNNDVELYYLTNANRKLEIRRNPSFAEIENDLTIRSAVQNNNQINIYTEDAENRWFLSGLIRDLLPFVKLLDVTIGCDQLIDLYNADIQYFGNNLIVFDGDVTDYKMKRIPENIQKNMGNILILPGGMPPEEVIYQYLLSLDPEHDFWNEINKSIGFTWDYFHENGPDSEAYRRAKKRDRAKKWFLDHKEYFDETGLLNYWIRDNEGLVNSFREQFKVAYNNVARRLIIPELPNI